jgi:hypothetical protein
VVRDGRLVNTLGRGNGFGEIALLGDGPRTATICASADAPVRVGIVARPALLTAVTGYPVGAAPGREVVARASPPRPTTAASRSPGPPRGQRAETIGRARRRWRMYGRPRPTMPTVPPMRRGHEGSARESSGTAMSSTSMK